VEFPGGVYVQEREGRLAWPEGPHREVHHHGGILADGIQHDRFFEFGHSLPDDVDRLCLQASKT
jgi:hypothetical protein